VNRQEGRTFPIQEEIRKQPGPKSAYVTRLSTGQQLRLLER
jgi:hypothetical protein